MLPSTLANSVLTYVTPEPRYLNNEPTGIIKGKEFFDQTCQEMCFIMSVATLNHIFTEYDTNSNVTILTAALVYVIQ